MWSPTISSDELYHHGILGMKWGIRRYQNKDGTLTAAGRKHLNMGEKRSPKTHPSLTDEDKAKLKNSAKTALKIGATVAVAYAGYKVATDPKIRIMAERGIDKLKGVNTKQSIEQLINNSGPQIVKKTKSNSMDSLKFAKQLSSNGKIRTDSVKDFNTVFGNMSVKKATAAATKTSGPKLEFGGPSSSSSSSDAMERLLKNSKTLSDIAKSSASNSNWATEYESYTRQLLNKNNGMLKNMTMDDLKKLDLY